MRPSARRRATVIAALLVGAGLVSSALAPSASAEPELTTTSPAESDATGLADDVQGPRASVLALSAEETSPARPQAAAAAPAKPRAPRAVAAERPTVVAPLSSYALSARFGSGGRHWSSGRHTGRDFAAPTGTPVRAVASGRVVEAGWDGPYGRVVVLAHAHAHGTLTRYAHLSSDAVSVGDRVEAGERIGRVGSTGNTTGSHLHLEVIVSGDLTDPARWLRAQGVRV